MRDWVEGWRRLLVTDAADERRVRQGRAFQRSGRVVGVRTAPGRLSGRVQGSRATPYHVEVLIPVLDDDAWRTVVDTVAGQVRFGARLLAGQMPGDLAKELAAGGVDLFAPAGVDIRCACGEGARPCAHAVALWEAAGEHFAADPFAFLHVRGRGRQRLLAELASVRRRSEEDEAADGIDPAELSAQGWFRAGLPLDDLVLPAADPPGTTAATLRLLGDPPGWEGGVSAHELFGPLVEGAAARARDLIG